MKISYAWLRDYIKTDTGPSEIKDILTNTGLEVELAETFETVKGGLQGCVVGRVLSCEKHPGAGKLSLTRVDIGEGEPLSIVCGAPNVKSGQKVVVARAGATLYPGGRPFTLKKARIRGVLSDGMICAEDELGLGDSHEGIMVLDADAITGTGAADYFGVYTDTVFEIGLTPNRIDGASHYGAARDLYAFLNLNGSAELIFPRVEPFRIDSRERPVEVVIENTAGCRRYAGITLSGITVSDSPLWLRNRLRSVGLTPINNIVDTTNYVLYELGQPLHAFDADRIRGNRVVVRTMEEGTRFITLDGQERILSGEDLMICNAAEGMCIAGVFGGMDSGVTRETRNVFLESAWFDPGYVRRTARRHGLQTDASFRFERGADPEMTVPALKRAALMIRELAGGRISSEIVDVYPRGFNPVRIRVHYRNVNRLIGEKLEEPVIHKILNLLEIKTEDKTEDAFTAVVPPYRVDVTREADVIEEILRIYGYNSVPIDHKMRSSVNLSEKPDKERMTTLVRDYLTNNGFSEIISNSLSKEAYYEGRTDTVHLSNPISADLGVMRADLVYGGLETVSYNINRRRPDLRLYEFGKCYSKKTGDQAETGDRQAAGETGLLWPYIEQEFFGLFITGNRGEGNWTEKNRPGSYFQLKAYAENILRMLRLNPDELETGAAVTGHFSEGLAWHHAKLIIAEIGIIKKELLSKFDIDQPVYYGSLNWNLILDKLDDYGITFRKIPRFPEVRRDLSMILDEHIRYEQIRNLARHTGKDRLKKISLFDVYEGGNIEPGKKSYAISLYLQDEDRTLTEDQIDDTINRLATAFEKKLGARIRK